MPYYTYFTLSVHEGTGINDNDFLSQCKKEISDLTEYENVWDGHPYIWDGHQEEMRHFSLRHPNTTFLLQGKGDDDDDFWREYYKNGEMQRCEAEIVYPPFDASKFGGTQENDPIAKYNLWIALEAETQNGEHHDLTNGEFEPIKLGEFSSVEAAQKFANQFKQ